jgi:hypothetical protein
MEPIPSHVNTFPIIAFMHLPVRRGECPSLGIAIADNSLGRPSYPYVVWDMALRNGTWDAYSGAWDLTWEEAVTEYAKRITRETHRAGGRGPIEPDDTTV